MYRKIVNHFKEMDIPSELSDVEKLISDEAMKIGALYAEALTGEKLSDVLVAFTKARLTAENLKLLYVKTSEVMPEDVRHHFDMANHSVSFLLNDIMGENFNEALEKSMEGALDSAFELESIIAAILNEMEIEDVII